MSKMRYRALGRSGAKVSELCLGTMMFGGPTSDSEARRIVDHAFDHGVNFIDTANAYTEGRSEETVGRTIAETRNRWIVATKVYNPMGPGINDRRLSRVHLVSALDASLKRLKTDHVDLYYVHRVDEETPWENLVATFGNFIAQGKIREWGLSNVRGWQIALVCDLCRQMNVPRPAALQPYYNLLNRQPEVELLPAAAHYGIGVVPYSPIARGVLSGKYSLNATPLTGSRAGRQDKRMLETEWRPESLEIAGKLKAHVDARGIGLVPWAVAWVLNNRTVSSTIAGPRTFEQWESYLPALSYAWTKEDEDIVDSLVTPGHASTPGYNDPAYPLTGRFSRLTG
jgi:aryl-alcohol dehydrogenase-like predicted oxidoreductase